MNQTLKKLSELIESSNVYRVNEYDYFVFPFKGITPIDVELLKQVSSLMEKRLSIGDYKIFTLMTDGIMIALPIAISLKKPLVVARDFHYNLTNVIPIIQKTNYYERRMYFSGIEKSDHVEIVDCIVSSGGSLLSAIDRMEEIGCEILGVHTLIDKIDYGGSEKIRRRGYKFDSFLDVTITGKKIHVRPSEEG